MKKKYGILFFCTICFILFTSLSGFAKGVVSGIITDAGSNEPLPAASVYLEGTSTGTITNDDGRYYLPVKSGSYTLQVSFLGYDTAEREITIDDGTSLEINVALNASNIMGEEVLVTSQARGQLSAVNKQLNSDKIMNAVSSERIKEFPDDNAAQSISRLPGVHLSGSSVVIRGIQPKMNKILINGIEMPSTDANTRSVSLDMVSSNSLSGIEVFKTATPDMDGDAIGGIVNLRLQEAPDEFNYSFMVQGNYNSQQQNGSYKIWADVSNRFFDKKLGVSVNANYNLNNGGYDEIRPGYSLESEGEMGKGKYMLSGVTVRDRIDKSNVFGGSLILDYRIPDGKIIFNSMFSDKTSNSLTHSDNLSASNLRRSVSIGHSAYSSLLWNNSLQFEKQFGWVKVDAMVSYTEFNRVTDYSYNYDFESTQVNFYADSLTNARKLEMEPHEMYNYAIPDTWETMRMKGFGWNPENYNENRVNASFNVEVPFSIANVVDIKLKIGGKYMRMQRERDYTRYRYGDDISGKSIHEDFKDWLVEQGHENWESTLLFTDFRNYDYEAGSNFLNRSENYTMPYVVDVDLTDKMAVDYMDHSKLQNTGDSYSGDYWGGERLLAGYFMGHINLWNKLLIIPGVRYENVRNEYTALKSGSTAKNVDVVYDTLSRPAVHAHFLPHLHARLNVTNWWNVRFSYNKTLSRPDYSYIIPVVTYNTVASNGNAGNPFLKPAVSENYDLNFTFHSKKLGLVTVGAFKKEIDGIFYSQTTLMKNLPDSTILAEFPIDKYPALKSGETNFYINNPNKAFLRGLELEWQSNLSYLPHPFNGLVLNANYTRVWSETDYPLHRVEKNFIPTFPYVEEVENDTVFTNRLIHQANDIANVSVGYDYKGFSARLSFRFQGNVMSSVSSRPEQDGFTNNDYKFDLAIRQQVPCKFARAEVYFNAVNFTNVPSRRYSVYPNKGETNTMTRYSGPQFQLGIRLRNKL
ncbi:MAG: TonB-dependent receptor [Prolixibacteraceae bacterium]|nr:TonB-dependent receptor [Prolixibacteraceae bacterium]